MNPFPSDLDAQRGSGRLGVSEVMGAFRASLAIIYRNNGYGHRTPDVAVTNRCWIGALVLGQPAVLAPETST
jgi:hypothetical protein